MLCYPLLELKQGKAGTNIMEVYNVLSLTQCCTKVRLRPHHKFNLKKGVINTQIYGWGSTPPDLTSLTIRVTCSAIDGDNIISSRRPPVLAIGESFLFILNTILYNWFCLSLKSYLLLFLPHPIDVSRTSGGHDIYLK